MLKQGERTEDNLVTVTQETETAKLTRKSAATPGASRCRPSCRFIEHRHEPEWRQGGACDKDLVKIDEDIIEQLDVEPASFFVHRHIRPQYACRACETVTAAPIGPSTTTRSRTRSVRSPSARKTAVHWL